MKCPISRFPPLCSSAATNHIQSIVLHKLGTPSLQPLQPFLHNHISDRECLSFLTLGFLLVCGSHIWHNCNMPSDVTCNGCITWVVHEEFVYWIGFCMYCSELVLLVMHGPALSAITCLWNFRILLVFLRINFYISIQLAWGRASEAYMSLPPSSAEIYLGWQNKGFHQTTWLWWWPDKSGWASWIMWIYSKWARTDVRIIIIVYFVDLVVL